MGYRFCDIHGRFKVPPGQVVSWTCAECSAQSTRQVAQEPVPSALAKRATPRRAATKNKSSKRRRKSTGSSVRRKGSSSGITSGLNGARGWVGKGTPRPEDAELHKRIGNTQNPEPGPWSQGG